MLGLIASLLLPLSAPAAPQFDTLNQAAQAGLQAAVTIDNGVEYAGGLYQCGDMYGYTVPVSNQDEEHFNIRIGLKSGCHLVGIFHTHPGIKLDIDEFSQNDIKTAESLHVPSFIYVVSMQQIKVYDPQNPRRLITFIRGKVGYRYGQVVKPENL